MDVVVSHLVHTGDPLGLLCCGVDTELLGHVGAVWVQYLHKDMVVEGKVEAVGHAEAVQVALAQVGHAPVHQRHLPKEHTHGVQRYER